MSEGLLAIGRFVLILAAEMGEPLAPADAPRVHSPRPARNVGVAGGFLAGFLASWHGWRRHKRPSRRRHPCAAAGTPSRCRRRSACLTRPGCRRSARP